MKKIFMLLSLLLVFQPIFASPIDDYSGVLQKISKPKGIDWKQLGSSEKERLGKYLESIATQNESDLKNDKAKLVFWINAYNACALKFVSDHMPIVDLMKIPGFRDRLKCKVAGEERTLIDIQSGIIRPRFHNPFVHFALWWGTKGGPRLLNAPYDGEKFDAQIKEQMENAFTHRKFVDLTQKPPTLSPIFDWFQSDFGKDRKGVIEFVKKNLPKEMLAQFPKKSGDIRYSLFDWSLDRTD